MPMKGPATFIDAGRPDPRTADNQMTSAMQVRNHGHRSYMMAPY